MMCTRNNVVVTRPINQEKSNHAHVTCDGYGMYVVHTAGSAVAVGRHGWIIDTYVGSYERITYSPIRTLTQFCGGGYR